MAATFQICCSSMAQWHTEIILKWLISHACSQNVIPQKIMLKAKNSFVQMLCIMWQNGFFLSLSTFWNVSVISNFGKIELKRKYTAFICYRIRYGVLVHTPYTLQNKLEQTLLNKRRLCILYCLCWLCSFVRWILASTNCLALNGPGYSYACTARANVFDSYYIDFAYHAMSVKSNMAGNFSVLNYIYQFSMLHWNEWRNIRIMMMMMMVMPMLLIR